MADVIAHDFGKERTEAARMMARLLGLLDKREADILADPVKFFNQAGERIGQMQQGIKDARDALRIKLDYEPSDDHKIIGSLYVPADEWERLQACAAIVRDLAKRFTP